ncbi:hypothetical protein QTJ16_004266 [Diplocarpon rosae]|uniref:Uncharacterized protein n=1 Tax=Diplocarpon rosae TaxID=946125 RepID=A0AAD9SZV5_9HELO|nr:hypothetical protein QTJ16_004266 [Diplocarpon rosae]PBP22921.1 ddt domain containing protein [Diplocarpon rosae]
MVLFKRKPVKYLSPAPIDSDDTEVWVINQTGEIFVEYEQYLARMDFYKQRRFICQITGHSGLSFFEALKSELAGAQEVEEAFPEALKGPILRRVQFQTISRIDTLVDLIFDEFRSDYYPGEAVTVHVVTGERLTGIVRDKTRFGAKQLPDGTVNPPFSRYFVSLDNRPTEEAVVDDAHITRDRKIFTKQVLRSFIKKTVTREAWTGAPWLVKQDVAAIYHIDVRVPPHLKYECKALERKNKQAQQKNAPDYEDMVGSFQGNGPRLPELKPATKSHKSKQQQGQQLAKSKQQTFTNYGLQDLNPPYPAHFCPPPYPYTSHNFQAAGPQQYSGSQNHPNYNNQHYPFHQLGSLPQAPLPPPPIKYPIEDLQVILRHDPPPKPALKYFSQDTPMDDGEVKEGNGILMKSVGPLLEIWDTLNVYCEVFKLDSFTFDDFVEAMQFSSEDVECELFVEVHCAALKLLVDTEGVHFRLPEADEHGDEQESGGQPSAPPTPTPEPEPKPRGRATRSSLAKAEAAALKAETEPMKEIMPVPKVFHRAAEMQQEVTWIDRLKRRDFKNGGWQTIVVGLLHQLSKDPRHYESCEILLKELAPLNMDPTPETARQQYSKLDVNLRVQALQKICILTAETKWIRAYMEECSEEMTGYRKEKIGHQRRRKELAEELRLLNEERKSQLPANIPPSAPVAERKSLNGDVSIVDAPPAEEVQDSPDEDVMETDDDPNTGRSLRRGAGRAMERKRKREMRQEKKEKDKAEAEAKVPKQSKQFTKLLKDIQKKQELIEAVEKEISILDNDLRENDCPRTRVLGKDRYWNRYYWFERNGMPYAGLPDSSTSDAGYANGRIWVQGPDDMEREGYIDMKPEWQNEHKARYNMTVPERKRFDEGSTSVYTAQQWGYYDDPESVDALIKWLDVRGINEIKLCKEMKLYRDRIVNNMVKRKEYLNPTGRKPIDSGSKRMSTRKKEQNVEHTAYRCLSWHNSTCVEEFGHLHSEPPRIRKASKKAAPPAPLPPPPVVEEERKTRSDAKGKKQRSTAR